MVEEQNTRVAAVWHALEVEEVLEQLSTSEHGLEDDEAQKRLERYGKNVLERISADGPLALLWRQINSPLIWVLLASSFIAIALGKVTDGLVVLAVVIGNSIIGFVQEFRAGRAIEALLHMVPENATAIRAGRRKILPVAHLVPGDIVMLASGDKVPADIRLIHLKGLQIDESPLTGESVPVAKTTHQQAAESAVADRTSIAYSGTMVTYGAGKGVVVATGTETELGRISKLLQEATNLDTPLTAALAEIAKYVTIGILVVTFILFAAGFYRAFDVGVPFTAALRETLMFAIALAVGAIPEGLPAIMTIALAIGVQRMASRRAIVRKLPAVETLGSTTVICSDKTGTLTRNEMTVQEVRVAGRAFHFTGSGYGAKGEILEHELPLESAPSELRQLLLYCVLCSDATVSREGGGTKITGDPTEAALIVAAEKAGLSPDQQRREHPRIDTIPFESENQFMAALHQVGSGDPVIMIKGAPEVVLHRCRNERGHSTVNEEQMLDEVEQLARRGMRVLAVAFKSWKPGCAIHLDDVAGGFRFLGLAAMIDPPREEAIAAIRACHEAGITVKMITGDHRATAQAIGDTLGISGEHAAVTGKELSSMSDQELKSMAFRANVFARVAPEHKLRLVRALQEGGQVVAMTGDGVNDAPALKQANIGIAMGITGTSVSKESADIVLTDDNFASIEAAVEEGRRVYDNLIKSLAFVLPTNLGLAMILTAAIIFFPYDPVTKQLLLPMEPTQLLWINLVATVTLALPLAFEARERDVMRRAPRRPNERVLSGFVIQRTLVAACLMTAGAVGLFLWEYLTHDSSDNEAGLAKAQTMAVTTVIMFQIFYMLNCRSLKHSLFSVGVFSNKSVFIGIASVLLLQAVYIYLPFMQEIFSTRSLGLEDIALAALVGAIILPAISLEKWLHRTQRARRKKGVGT